MKKIILTIGILFMCLSIQAQFYLKGYTGYSLSASDSRASYIQEVNGIMNGASINAEFGQGLNLGLSAGYALNKNIAIEITGNTQLFSGLNFSVEPDFGAPLESGNWNWRWIHNGWVLGKNKTTNHIIQLAPQLVLSSNPYGNWNFYLKGGPDLLYAKYTVCQNAPGYITPFERISPSLNIKREYSGEINIGTQFSTGAEYSLKENLRLFAEITAVSVRYNFNKGKYLQYEVDGVDTDSGEEDYKVNFNHLGLNIGIKYTFR